MPERRDLSSVVRFGSFELDDARGELRKKGVRLRLEGQPLQILRLLIQRNGDLVSREELREALWPTESFGDFEHNLNSAVKRLRAALDDSGYSPRYIERLPKRGYRLLVPVVRMEDTSSPPAEPERAELPPPDPPVLAGAALPPRMSRRLRTTAIGVLVPAVIALGAYAYGRWSSERARSAIRAIAVLPFDTAEAPAADATTYAAFGLTDALTAELSKLEGLRVASATSARWSRETSRTLPEIAQLLNVDAVVEGSIVQEGSQLRVTVQLIDAATDYHLWANTYTREAGSLLSLQLEIAQAVAREIRLTLTPARQDAIPMTPITDPVAERAYLEGRFHLSRGTEDDLIKARHAFERAIARRPRHARAHAGLADVYAVTDTLLPSEALPIAKKHAMQALAIDDRLAGTHATLGFIAFYGDWDWLGAERSLLHALDLDPSDVRSIRLHARVVGAFGRTSEALASVRRAVQMDPVSIGGLDSQAHEEIRAREYAAAIETAQRIIDLDPNDSRGYEHRAVSHALLGRVDGCLTAVDRARALIGPAPHLLAIDTYCLARAGRAGQAERRYAELTARARAGYVPPYFLAIAALGRDRRDEAVGWLERGYRERDAYMVELKMSPWLDPLRSDPRLQRLLRQLNFP